MIMKGQKRKLQTEDSEDTGSGVAGWETQRQSVLYISLDKYQRGQELPEPSLRRSVLIANTLRQLEIGDKAHFLNTEAPSPFSIASALQEREKESVLHRVASPNRPPAIANCHSTVGDGSSGEPLCQSVTTNCASTKPPANYLSNPSNCPPSVEDEDEDWVSMSSDPDFSLSAAITSILTALDSTIDGNSGVTVPQAAPRTPLRSLENLSAPGGPGGDAAGLKQGIRGHWGSWERQEGEVSDGSVEAMSSSYLGDVSVDDLFQDIDTSLLEREMGMLGMRGGGGLSAGDELLRYLPSLSSFPLSSSPSASPSLSSPAAFSPAHPLTISLNHSLKCLPSFSSFGPPSSSPSLSPSSPFSGQSHLHDLEHLMEILVES